MEITVNNQTYVVHPGCSLRELLAVLSQHSTGGMAMAVNHAVIAKTRWEDYFLQPGDQVMLIKATQGG